MKMLNNMLKIFKCLQCGSIFDRPSQLKYHYRNKHLGEKSHVCQICEKAFFRKADLRMHLNIHLGTNFYICEVCGRKFNHISNLIRHCRIHTGIKPYVCPICDKRFTQISSLAKHKQIHTPKDFTQQYCNPSLINDKLQAKDCTLNENEIINNDVKNKNEFYMEQKCIDQNTVRVSDIQSNEIIFVKQTDMSDKACLPLETVAHVVSKQDHFTEIEEKFKSINLSTNKTVVSNCPLDKAYNEQKQSKDLVYQFSKNVSTFLSRGGESNAELNIHNDVNISRLNDSDTYAVQETRKETPINNVKNLLNVETNLQTCSQNFSEILTNKKFLPKQIYKEIIGENRKGNKLLNEENQLYFSDLEILKLNESRYCHNTDFVNVNVNHTVKSQHSESIAATDALYTSIANEDQDNLLQHNEDILNNSNNAALNNEESMLRLVQTETGEQFYEYIINNLEKVQNVSCRKNVETATEEAANVLGDCEKINSNFKENNKKSNHIEHHQNLENLTINNEFNYAQLESHGEEKNSSVLCHSEHFQNSQQAYNFENLELLESQTDFDKYVETNFEALERLNYENYEKFLELEVSRIADTGVEFYKEPSMVRLVQNDGEQLLELLQDSQIIEQENQNFIQINNLNKDCLNVLQDSNKITDCSKSKSDFFTYVENNMSLEENINNNQAVENNEKYVNNNVQQFYRDIVINESVNNKNCVRTSEKPKKQKITSKRFCCSVCNKTFSTAYNYSQHIGIHFTDQQKFHCKDCGISFAWKSTLNKHILSNHSLDGPQKFICEICPKVYSTLSQVNEHVKRDHLKERNHVCQTCGKTFFKRFDLKIHSRTHTDERPYVCNVCNKGFHHQSHFIRHMRIHMGVKPYACNYCPKRFTQLGAFKQHCQKHPVHIDFTDYQIFDREKDARTGCKLMK